MRKNQGRKVFSMLLVLGLCVSGLTGCGVFHAAGQSVEAVGEGTGHAVAGTGRAVSNAASETKRDLTGR
jgi:hypothetical protein